MTIDYVETRLESSDFPCDDVQVHKLRGTETIGQLFRFELTVACTLVTGIPVEQMIGARATIVFSRVGGDEVRRIHGMICEVEERFDMQGDAHGYELVFVPRAHRLSLVAVQAVYLDLSVPEIIAQKLEAVGLTAEDYDMRLLGTYPKRELVVQYKETDLAFVSRLAEHVGISFTFDHGEGHDRIVWSDDQAGFPHLGEALLRKTGDQKDIFRFAGRTKVIPASYAVHDYNYRTPQVDLTDGTNFELPHADCQGGVVEYGGHFKTTDDGKALAKIRAEERQAKRLVYSARSDLPQLAAGARFHLDGPIDIDSRELLITHIEHRATQTVVAVGGASEPHYQNDFRAVPGEQTYRPPRVTACPKIYGVLNAIVEHAIEDGVERIAKIDDQGRYTVRFLFDVEERAGPRSRWTRWIQPHVGTNYGIHFPLKPGMEVLMTFVDGDPDRPLIVGGVYRPDTPSPVREAEGLNNPRINKIKTESGVIIEIFDF
jgi:type VI secretion system secreted protein VgrG